MPLLASNFVANSLQGTVVVDNGWANVNLKVEPFALEGNKSFVIKLRKNGFSGPVLSTSAPITITDNSTVATVTANVNSIAEGNLVQFTVTTTNVINNANLFFSVLPRTANITSADFTANTGKVTIVNNTGIFALQANADLSLIDETGETFAVQMRSTSSTGNVVFSNLSNITILDVSKGFNILSFVENSSTVAEGGTLTLTFNATNIPAGTVFHYFTEGNATTSTFTGGNTGSFVMNGFSNTVTLLPTGVPYSTTQNFNVVLRSLSNTGAVVATSNNLIVIDSALAYMTATGGTITDSGGYRIHAFATSGNLTVSALGAGSGNFVEYLTVGGGAAGGRNGGAPNAGGGGGGAGGALLSNITFTSTGNSVITVGAGGSLVGFNVWPLPPGGNTIVTFAGNPAIIAYGGGGGSHSWPDHGAGFGGARAGGSGGGGNTNTGFPAGAGTPGQGNPGGASSPTSFGGAGGNFAGGGGGAGEAGHYQPTDSVSPVSLTTQAGGNGIAVPWAPPSTGTSGPAPGRWFAGGGGGGGSPQGSAYILSGGAGGGGAGGFSVGGYPTSAQALGTAHGGFDGGANATINTGGGGGGAGNGGASSGTGLAGLGGSGIVLIRYPYVPPLTISNVVTTSNVFSVGSNITFTVNAQNANLTTLYYSTDGNVDSTYFIGGNTGSFVANASGGIIALLGNISATVPVGQTRNFRLQIRQDSTTGFISGSSSNITLLNSADFYINATGGNVTIANGYKTHIFSTSSNLIITSSGFSSIAEILVVAGGGGGGQLAGGGGGAGGLLYGTNVMIAGTYLVQIGAGGNGGSGGNPNRQGFAGTNSRLGDFIANGGGAGGGNSFAAGTPGGSGGGAAAYGPPTGGAATQSSSGSLTGYGNTGGPSGGGAGLGGGGGAGGAGGYGATTNEGGSPAPGGAGRSLAITGSNVTYGAGGAGGTASNTPGPANSGNGGSGIDPNASPSANGGSGIVIIRYPYS